MLQQSEKQVCQSMCSCRSSGTHSEVVLRATAISAPGDHSYRQHCRSTNTFGRAYNGAEQQHEVLLTSFWRPERGSSATWLLLTGCLLEGSPSEAVSSSEDPPDEAWWRPELRRGCFAARLSSSWSSADITRIRTTCTNVHSLACLRSGQGTFLETQDGLPTKTAYTATQVLTFLPCCR